ncbi:MAG: DUF2752 domain-containing protein [Bacteroidetes bacterium]|nr:DUF2752 domain-containing protein [Bacteroidota bacterium]MBK9526388.1 DUF2752 domain-containing protein [Bacteroidota bacterium]MBK9544033.1 DUF2752 domain-containing protein [Bacteroidota bacterium]MBP6400991.1 DUF2752 domain-containing protein [Bacteroidia bacterium]
MNNFTINKKIIGISGAILALLIPAIILLLNPHLEGDQSLCPFKMLTGFPCPGCGLTKSMVFFYEGDWNKSLSYHIFGPAFIFFCVLAIVTLSTELVTKKEYFKKLLFNIRVAYVAGLMLGSYHLVRLFYFVMEHNVNDILKESVWR